MFKDKNTPPLWQKPVLVYEMQCSPPLNAANFPKLKLSETPCFNYISFMKILFVVSPAVV
jgi:hypothetical protein